MKYQAVVDRIEGDQAVLEVSGGQQTLPVLLKALPAGTKEGTHLIISLQNGLLVKARVDRASAQAGQERINNKVADLRQQSKGVDSLNQ
jgi:hypothetical protein